MICNRAGYNSHAFTLGGLRPALLRNLEVFAVFLSDKMSFESCLQIDKSLHGSSQFTCKRNISI